MITVIVILIGLFLFIIGRITAPCEQAGKNTAIAAKATAAHKALQSPERIDHGAVHLSFETHEGWTDMRPTNTLSSVPIYLGGQYIGQSYHTTEFVAYIAVINYLIRAKVVSAQESFLVHYFTPLVDNDENFLTKYPKARKYISDNEENWKTAAYAMLPKLISGAKEALEN